MEGENFPFEQKQQRKKHMFFFGLEGWRQVKNKKNKHKKAGVSGLMEFLKKTHRV